MTVYTYTFDETLDVIQWQEEEVSWGDFVPYDVVQRAGALLIGRLPESGDWPNLDDNAREVLTSVEGLSCESVEGGDEWDFVPDGLLAWVAWLKWMASNSETME